MYMYKVRWGYTDALYFIPFPPPTLLPPIHAPFYLSIFPLAGGKLIEWAVEYVEYGGYIGTLQDMYIHMPSQHNNNTTLLTLLYSLKKGIQFGVGTVITPIYI